MTKIGLLLDRTTNFVSGEQLAQVAKNIESQGFESVWLLDAFGREPFLAAGFILANTHTLKVGTGVATAYGRDATGAVQALHTLSEFYPGRFFMGLGASNPMVIAKRKGTWVPPLPKMTSYLTDMAEVQLAAIKPEQLAPVYIAAHGPGLQSLVAERAQGMLTWMMPVQTIAAARKHIGPDLAITAQILCVATADADEARRIARSYLAMYLALPYYHEAFSKAGFDPKECTEGGGSDRLIDSVLAWGSPSEILEKVAQFGEAGATRVVLNPLRIDYSQEGKDGAPVLDADWEGAQRLAAEIARRQT